jgi:hypothetical protein
LVDAVSVDDDPAFGRLAKYLGQTHDRDGARPDDVREHLARANGGQLIDVGRPGAGTVSSSACISRLSTMEVSSTTKKSHPACDFGLNTAKCDLVKSVRPAATAAEFAKRRNLQ